MKVEKIYCDCCGKDISRPHGRFDRKYSLGYKVKKLYFRSQDHFWDNGEWHPEKGRQDLELCEDCFNEIGRRVKEAREKREAEE